MQITTRTEKQQIVGSLLTANKLINIISGTWADEKINAKKELDKLGNIVETKEKAASIEQDWK